ncbi:MAG: hypothetical protein ACYTEX_06485, partial [Planctomycetota bacterium]
MLGFGAGLYPVRLGSYWVQIGFYERFFAIYGEKTGQNRAVSATFEQRSFSFFKKLIVSGQNRKPGQENHPCGCSENADSQEKAGFCREESCRFWGQRSQKSGRFWKKVDAWSVSREAYCVCGDARCLILDA